MSSAEQSDRAQYVPKNDELLKSSRNGLLEPVDWPVVKTMPAVPIQLCVRPEIKPPTNALLPPARWRSTYPVRTSARYRNASVFGAGTSLAELRIPAGGRHVHAPML